MSFLAEWITFLGTRKNIFLRPLVALILLCIALFLSALANTQAVSPFAYRIF